jgi:hypothetical protein
MAMRLLEDHAKHQTTLTLFGLRTKGDGDWLDNTRFENLQAAVDAMIYDAGELAPYDLVIHTPAGDEQLTEEQREALVAYVKKRRQTDRI